MSKDKRGLGEVEFAGKVKTQTFKQLQLEHLLKSGAVISASKLAEPRIWSYSAAEPLKHRLRMRNVIARPL